ncbi:MAG: thiolase family protein [Solirubrobacterales bacterium]
MADSDARVAITGVGVTRRATAIDDRTAMDLQLEAALAAIGDSGRGKEEIDGVITHGAGRLPRENPRAHIELTERLGIFHKAVCLGVPAGGAAPGTAMIIARAAIRAGRCRNVLLVDGEAGAGGEEPATSEMAAAFSGRSPSFEQPFGASAEAEFALLARRHMHDYGTTAEQLAAVVVAASRHAALNPAAVHQDPLDIAGVLGAPTTAAPLHRPEVAPRSEGAAAMVVSAVGGRRTVEVAGLGQASTALSISGLADRRRRPAGLTSTPGGQAMTVALEESGLTRADLAFAQLADDATITVLVQLEDLGFCAKGEGGPFVTAGAISLGGALPVNTHGGHLRAGRTPAGYGQWIEAVRQLRGEGGERQVPGAQAGLVTSTAGPIAAYGAVAVLVAA